MGVPFSDLFPSYFTLVKIYHGVQAYSQIARWHRGTIKKILSELNGLSECLTRDEVPLKKGDRGPFCSLPTHTLLTKYSPGMQAKTHLTTFLQSSGVCRKKSFMEITWGLWKRTFSKSAASKKTQKVGLFWKVHQLKINNKYIEPKAKNAPHTADLFIYFFRGKLFLAKGLNLSLTGRLGYAEHNKKQLFSFFCMSACSFPLSCLKDKRVVPRSIVSV